MLGKRELVFLKSMILGKLTSSKGWTQTQQHGEHKLDSTSEKYRMLLNFVRGEAVWLYYAAQRRLWAAKQSLLHFLCQLVPASGRHRPAMSDVIEHIQCRVTCPLIKFPIQWNSYWRELSLILFLFPYSTQDRQNATCNFVKFFSC